MHRRQPDDERPCLVRRSHRHSHPAFAVEMREFHLAPSQTRIQLTMIKVWNLHLPPRQKLGVGAMFLLGLMYFLTSSPRRPTNNRSRTVSSGIAKLVSYYRVFHLLSIPTNYDITCKTRSCRPVFSAHSCTDSQTPFVYWAMIECAVGVVGACLPMMRPVLSRLAARCKRKPVEGEEERC